MANFEIKSGEGKVVTFTVTDSNGAAVNLTDVIGCTLTFAIHENKGDDALITKSNSDFDKTYAVDGIVSVLLTPTDTETTLGEGTYIGELKSAFSGNITDKSVDIDITVLPAVTT